MPDVITASSPREPRLPKGKSDYEAVEQLNALSSTEIEPLIPELLTWLQDVNWPIFSPVLDLLARHPRLLVEPVRRVLQGDDDAWIAYCVGNLVKDRLPREQQISLKLELERIANNPTDAEKEWEVQDDAQEVLNVLETRA
ncbi:hypothetical protein NEOLEDRAFT_283846 [Neolentinus lepideus HHB14362 ss-1]|uniref:DUF5071 domain-containing protein n=1 Tax=Neolentinus lepideus HHB14362 ss-1 TaxID=1314782 RepID=A0A165SYY3_9AGAM|nr:hypothetical protein NEOLEDRAFT_283846 [Neolentinus lepideus HHB14362 ss-1]